MFNPMLPNQADEKLIRKYFIQRGATYLKKQAGYQPTLRETNFLMELQSLAFIFYDKICEQNAKGSK